jgi:hypothetical protein
VKIEENERKTIIIITEGGKAERKMHSLYKMTSNKSNNPLKNKRK